MSTQKLLKNYPKRGEVYVADLNPSYGREIHKKRPVLIVSNNIINQQSPNLIMVPFSSIIPHNFSPDMVKVSRFRWLDKTSVILTSEIRSIDKIRLIKKIGILSKDKLLEVEESIKLVLGMINLD